MPVANYTWRRTHLDPALHAGRDRQEGDCSQPWTSSNSSRMAIRLPAASPRSPDVAWVRLWLTGQDRERKGQYHQLSKRELPVTDRQSFVNYHWMPVDLFNEIVDKVKQLDHPDTENELPSSSPEGCYHLAPPCYRWNPTIFVTDERRFLIKSRRTPKSGKKFRHAEIFSPIGFGCRFASRMNCDELGWSGWTGILWRFWNFQNREQIGVCGTAV